MLDKMTERLNFHGNALVLRAERQRAIASNIANADTPGYVGRDFKFADALRNMTGSAGSAAGDTGGAPVSTVARLAMSRSTDSRHIPLSATTVDIARNGAMGYTLQSQPSLDNNSVDLDRERANFVDNAVRYEATLRFINGNAKTMLSAIQGQ